MLVSFLINHIQGPVTDNPVKEKLRGWRTIAYLLRVDLTNRDQCASQSTATIKFGI